MSDIEIKNDTASAASKYDTIKFEDYKLFVEHTQKLSEARASWTQRVFFANITVYSAIFTVIGFWIQNKEFGGWLLAFSCLPLFIIGILSCLYWHHVIMQYKALIGWRYDALMTIERDLPFIYQMYSKEWDEFFKPRMGLQTFGFSWEAWLPRFVLSIYMFFAVFIIALSQTSR